MRRGPSGPQNHPSARPTCTYIKKGSGCPRSTPSFLVPLMAPLDFSFRPPVPLAFGMFLLVFVCPPPSLQTVLRPVERRNSTMRRMNSILKLSMWEQVVFHMLKEKLLAKVGVNDVSTACMLRLAQSHDPGLLPELIPTLDHFSA